MKLDLNKYGFISCMFVSTSRISLKNIFRRRHLEVFRVWPLGSLLEHGSRWEHHHRSKSTHKSVWQIYLLFLSWLYHFSSVWRGIIFNLKHFHSVRNCFLTANWWSISIISITWHISFFLEEINANLGRTRQTKQTQTVI